MFVTSARWSIGRVGTRPEPQNAHRHEHACTKTKLPGARNEEKWCRSATTWVTNLQLGGGINTSTNCSSTSLRVTQPIGDRCVSSGVSQQVDRTAFISKFSGKVSSYPDQDAPFYGTVCFWCLLGTHTLPNSILHRLRGSKSHMIDQFSGWLRRPELACSFDDSYLAISCKIYQSRDLPRSSSYSDTVGSRAGGHSYAWYI